MAITHFPPVESSDMHGILAAGGDLEVDSLLLAYKSGIFPWPMENYPLLWWCPPRRGVLFFDNYHVSRSLRKEIKRTSLSFTINSCFEKVISECARCRGRKGEKGTWITPEIIEAYIEFYNAGWCYSVEAWKNGQLAGGLYGVSIGAFVSAESMYYQEPNASKLCLHYLVERLKANNVSWLDLQVLNPFTRSVGGSEINRTVFIKRLKEAIHRDVKLFPRKSTM